MTIKQLKEVENALCDFVVRASKEGATPEEVQALPKVAEVVISIQPE